MALQFFYDVGPGKTYANHAAVTNLSGTGQLDVDAGGVGFDKEVMIRSYDATFAERVDVFQTLKPSYAFRLILKSVNKWGAVIDAAGEAYGIYISRTDPDLKSVAVDGYHVKNSTSFGIYHRAYFGTTLNMKVTNCGEAATLRSIVQVTQNCVFEDGAVMADSYNPEFWGCFFGKGVTGDYAVRFLSGYGARFYVCSFDGQNLTGDKQCFQNAREYALFEFYNCTFKGGDYAIGSDLIGGDFIHHLVAVNCIFDGQDIAIDIACASTETWAKSIIEGCTWYNIGTALLNDANGYAFNVDDLRANKYDKQWQCKVENPGLTSPYDGTLEVTSTSIESGVGGGPAVTGIDWVTKFNAWKPSRGCDSSNDRQAEPMWDGDGQVLVETRFDF